MSKFAWSIASVGCRSMMSTGVFARCAIGSTIDEVRYVVRKMTMRSASAVRSFSAAAADSCASETKPTSMTSAPVDWNRFLTWSTDFCSCGLSSGNWGQ